MQWLKSQFEFHIVQNYLPCQKFIINAQFSKITACLKIPYTNLISNVDKLLIK